MENDFQVFVTLYDYRAKTQRAVDGPMVDPINFRVLQVVQNLVLSRVSADLQDDGDDDDDPTEVVTEVEFEMDLWA